MKSAQNAAVLSLVAALAGVAGAGIEKAAGPPQTVALRQVRYGGGSAQLMLSVRQGALAAGIEVRCAADGSAQVAGQPAPAAADACKAALAVPVEIGKIASELSANH